MECNMPRWSRVLRIWTTCGRRVTSVSSSRMPSQTVLSRSQTTHLMDCFSFFFSAIRVAALVSTSSMAFSWTMLELLEVEAGDGDLLDLRAPLDDLHHPGVAQVAPYGVVGAEAVGTMDLDRVG